MNKIIILFLFFVLIGCGTTHQLKKFNGYKIEHIEKEFGKPNTIIPTSEGQLYIYQKNEKLRSTEISKGQLTLDPMLTPVVTKTEKIIFTVKNGIVVNVKHELEYNK